MKKRLSALSDLINRILAVDPSRRFTIEKVKQHQWFQVYAINVTTFLAAPSISISSSFVPSHFFFVCAKRFIAFSNYTPNEGETMSLQDTDQVCVAFFFSL